MTQAAHAHDMWADPTPRRRRPEPASWAEADDLEILAGIGEDRAADWTVLTLERDDAPAEADAPADAIVQLERPGRPRAVRPDVAGADALTTTEMTVVPAPVVEEARREGARRRRRPVDDWTADAFGSSAGVDDWTAETFAVPARAGDAPRPPIAGTPAGPHAVDDVPDVMPVRPRAEQRPAEPGGRRTVVIRGQAAPMRPVNDRRRPAPRPVDRIGHRPDRVAMWAFMLGLLLIIVATMTAGG